MKRWWADPEQANACADTITASDGRHGVGVAFYTLHAIGAAVLRTLAQDTVVDESRVRRALVTADGTSAKRAWTVTCGADYDQMHRQAVDGALAGLRTLTAKGIPWPLALDRVAAGYGLPAKPAVALAGSLSAPAVPPTVVIDAGDLALATYAARLARDPIVKADVDYVEVTVGGRKERRRVLRDSEGQFAAQGQADAVREQEQQVDAVQQEKQRRRDKVQARASKQRKQLKRVERVVSAQRAQEQQREQAAQRAAQKYAQDEKQRAVEQAQQLMQQMDQQRPQKIAQARREKVRTTRRIKRNLKARERREQRRAAAAARRPADGYPESAFPWQSLSMRWPVGFPAHNAEAAKAVYDYVTDVSLRITGGGGAHVGATSEDDGTGFTPMVFVNLDGVEALREALLPVRDQREDTVTVSTTSMDFVNHVAGDFQMADAPFQFTLAPTGTPLFRYTPDGEPQVGIPLDRLVWSLSDTTRANHAHRDQAAPIPVDPLPPRAFLFGAEEAKVVEGIYKVLKKASGKDAGGNVSVFSTRDESYIPALAQYARANPQLFQDILAVQKANRELDGTSHVHQNTTLEGTLELWASDWGFDLAMEHVTGTDDGERKHARLLHAVEVLLSDRKIRQTGMGGFTDEKDSDALEVAEAINAFEPSMEWMRGDALQSEVDDPTFDDMIVKYQDLTFDGDRGWHTILGEHEVEE